MHLKMCSANFPHFVLASMCKNCHCRLHQKRGSPGTMYPILYTETHKTRVMEIHFVTINIQNYKDNKEAPITHWGWDKMAAVLEMTFSNAFTWMKLFKLRLIFHCNLFLMVKLIIFQHRLRYWLGADWATSHYLNQRCLVHWCICMHHLASIS